MKTNNFYKAECNGNDFVIVLQDDSSISLSTEKIQNICSQESTDGLLLVNQFFNEHDFKMDYYNNDGSWETMCANGALCIIKLLQSMKYNFIYKKFVAGDGNHQIKFIDDEFGIKMKSPNFKTENIDILGYTGAHIDSGAKHFVTLCDSKDIKILYDIAQGIRYHDYFSPTGLNVNFLSINNSNYIHVITYEKGIEKIMKSCGSGSVAAAFYASKKVDIQSPLIISNPGGNMRLEFNIDWSDVWLFSHPSINTL